MSYDSMMQRIRERPKRRVRWPRNIPQHLNPQWVTPAKYVGRFTFEKLAEPWAGLGLKPGMTLRQRLAMFSIFVPEKTAPQVIDSYSAGGGQSTTEAPQKGEPNAESGST